MAHHAVLEAAATRRGKHDQPTAFAQRVYAVIQRIPPGEVRSYQWVAQQMGKPRSARAVGQALKRNPSPIRVPCHRVIRSDGTLGGYSGGLPKKRGLLRREGARGAAW